MNCIALPEADCPGIVGYFAFADKQPNVRLAVCLNCALTLEQLGYTIRALRKAS